MDGGCPERELVREAGHRVWPGDSGGTARAQCVSDGQNEHVGGGSRVMGGLPCAVSDRATKVVEEIRAFSHGHARIRAVSRKKLAALKARQPWMQIP